MKIFSERLQNLTTANGFYKKQVAKGAGIPLRTYQRYENGEREPSASIIASLARFFGCSSDYLLGLSDESKPLDEDELAIVKQWRNCRNKATAQ